MNEILSRYHSTFTQDEKMLFDDIKNSPVRKEL